MWHNEVQKNVKHYGTLHSAWQSSGQLQVICLLDPPRNALQPHSYQEAQQNVWRIFEQIPGKETLVVGLQEEFWKEARSTNYYVPANYLDNGGLGIVYALSKASPRPDSVGLESETLVTQYKRLEDAAIGFMSRSAPFFQLISRAYREATQRYSVELQAFVAFVASYWRDHAVELRAYVSQLLEKARSLDIKLGAPRYKALLVLESIGRLEPQVQEQKQQKVGDVAEPLAQTILMVAQPETINRRAVWQLYRYLLQAPAGTPAAKELDETTEAEIERIDQMLQQDTLSEPPREIVDKACQLVKERCLVDVLMVRPGEDKQELLGQQGAMLTNLLELAAVLSIAPDAFAWIVNYMHYLYFYERLKTISGNQEARVMSDSMAHLEREIGEHMAQSPVEMALVEMEPAIQFMEALGRYHILHGEEWRRVIMRFSVPELCESLYELGLPLPQQWQTEAAKLDEEFASVRDFFDLTVARGKDLANSLFAAMNERNFEHGMLYCDAYLYENLSRWFQGHDVSYSFLFPKFSVT